MQIINSFEIEGERFYFYDITKILNNSIKLKRLPVVLKILLEENLRKAKDESEFQKIVDIFENRKKETIGFYPSRMIIENFSNLPMLIDLASFRDIMKEEGKSANIVNPKIMIDLVIDNSLEILNYKKNDGFNFDKKEEEEKYKFIKWAQNSFSNLRVVPPGSGICHQVNLEYLSTILHIENIDDKFFLYPETIVGTDSRMTMANSIGVLGWSISSVQLESVMLGSPFLMVLPQVVGINIKGELKEGITSFDLLITLTNLLKEKKLEGKLLEFYGEGLKYLTLEDRTAISNMAFEYKAKCSFFAIDNKTINYFDKTRDNEDFGKLVKTYLQKQNLFFSDEEFDYDEVIDFNLSILKPSIAIFKKTQESVDINSLKDFPIIKSINGFNDGDIVLSTITSCNSNSNPYLLIHSALVAKKALELGLKIDDSIKSFLIPGSLVVKEYLDKLGLLKYFDEIGLKIKDFECSSSYVHLEELEKEIKNEGLNLCSVTSGNRNFEGEINPFIKSNYMMSPSLVIIYSLIGTIKFDIFNDAIGEKEGFKIFLKDLWPSNHEVISYLGRLDYTLYKKIYKNIFKGDSSWQELNVEKSETYFWDKNSSYIQPSRIFNRLKNEVIDIKKAEILSILGDNITTEQISPSGQISLYSPASKYLESLGIKSFEYNTFNSRNGNIEIMNRALFDTSDIKNLMTSKEGAFSVDYEFGEILPIYEKAAKFKEQNRDLIIIAGEGFGIGESKYWAAKTVAAFGIKAVIAKSFGKKHREDLISFGVLPLEFIDDDTQSLKLKGSEKITIFSNDIKQNSVISATVQKGNIDIELDLKCRLETEKEIELYKNGGLLSDFFKVFDEVKKSDL